MIAARYRDQRLLQQTFQRSVLNKATDMNLQLIQQAKHKFEKNKRNYMIYQNNRWKTFRINKEIIVDQWLECKRTQRIAEGFVKLMAVLKVIKRAVKNFDQEDLLHQMQMMSVYMSMRIFQEARKKILRQGQWEDGYCYDDRKKLRQAGERLGDIGARDWTFKDVIENRDYQKERIRRCCENSVRHKLRDALSVLPLWGADRRIEESKQKVTDFMLQLQTRGKFSTFRVQFSAIQLRLRQQMAVKYSKVDVLLNYWDKVVGSIIKDNIKFKDKKAGNLAIKISSVPPQIKREVLKSYINRCKVRYNIAFMQWRYLHPNEENVYYDKEALEDIIMARIGLMESSIQEGQRVTKQTEEMAEINTDFLIKFGFDDPADDMKDFMINSFRQVGMSDPFPDDDQFIEGSLDDVDPELYKVPQSPDELVYPAYRYVKGRCPYCIYIPRKEIMLKIMRACVGVDSVSEVWYHQ
jgi:hypothetical protein